MADDTITFPGATTVEWEGVTYTADPFGRFTVPGPAQVALVAAGWHIWTPADAPAFGEWVGLLPTIAEATDEDLFPCFVDLEGAGGLPEGLAYRAVGAVQAELGGVIAYMSGPSFPADLAVPDPASEVCALPDTILPNRHPLLFSAELDMETFQPSLSTVVVQYGESPFMVRVGSVASGLLLVANTLWNVA